jgi:cell division protein FtsL
VEARVRRRARPQAPRLPNPPPPAPPRTNGRRRRGALSLAGWLLPLLAALALVIVRQTQGLALEQQLREVREKQAIVEAERVETVRRIQTLSSRARVVRAARERLGMHLPAVAEIIFVAVPAVERDSAAAAPAGDEPALAVQR